MPVTKIYDAILVGQMMKDLIVLQNETITATGGAAYYAGLVMQKLGLRTAVITKLAKTDEELLALLQNHRRSQYEKLSDEVYLEKGYDRNSIPHDETLKRLGLDEEHYYEIVRSARARIADNEGERKLAS